MRRQKFGSWGCQRLRHFLGVMSDCGAGRWRTGRGMSLLPFNRSLRAHSTPFPACPFCKLQIRLVKTVQVEIAFHVHLALVKFRGHLIEGKEA